MGEFWKLAVSLTGISGVGAAVFYALYKQWLNPTILKGLGEASKLELFKVFLCLTFFFGIATLALGAYKMYVDSTPVRVSMRELLRNLKDKHETGERIFKDLQEDPTVPDVDKEAIRKLHADYTLRARKTEEAISMGDMNRFSEHNKSLIRMLDSDDAKTHIPQLYLGKLGETAHGNQHMIGD
jgi:hypothetical protein